MSRVYFSLLVFVAVVAPFIITRRCYEHANAPQVAFIQAGTFLAASLWFIRSAAAGRVRVRGTRFHMPILVFVLWSWTSLLWAHNGYEVDVRSLHWTACAVFFFIVAGSVENARDAMKLSKALFVSGFIVCAVGICQHLFAVEWFPQAIPPAATFVNKNLAVQYVVPLIPLGVTLYFVGEKRFEIWFFGTAVALCCGFLFYTFTKAGWLALGMEAVFLTAVAARDRLRGDVTFRPSRNRGWSLLVCLAVFVVMVNLTSSGLRWRFGEIFSHSKMIWQPVREAISEEATLEDVTEGRYQSSVGVRLAMWRNVLAMVRERPILGVGTGNARIHYPLFHRRVVADPVFGEQYKFRNMHNDFLQILAELGLVGAILASWIGFVFLSSFVHVVRSESHSESRSLTIALSVGIAGLLVNAFFSFPLYNAVPPFLLAALMGTLAALSPSGERDSAGRSGVPVRISLRVLRLASFICPIVLVVIAYTQFRALKADVLYRRMVTAERRGKWEKVLRFGTDAQRWNPYRKEILAYTGLARIKTGNPESGAEDLKGMLAAYPNDINSILNLGKAYEDMGRLDEAGRKYRRAVEIAPGFAKAHNNLGNILRMTGHVKDALGEYRRAVEIEPQTAAHHYNLGVAYLETESYGEATAAFERAIQIRPDLDLAHKELGKVLFFHLGRREEGLRHVAKALDLNPSIRGADDLRRLLRDWGPEIRNGS